MTTPLSPRRRQPPGNLADVPYAELADALRTQAVRAAARRYGVYPNTVRYWRTLLPLPPPARPTPAGPALNPPLLALLQQAPAGLPTPTLCLLLPAPYQLVYRRLCRLEALG